MDTVTPNDVNSTDTPSATSPTAPTVIEVLARSQDQPEHNISNDIAPEVAPSRDEPANTIPNAIAPKAIQFLHAFFLAMQITGPQSTEDLVRLFHFVQATMLDYIESAERLRQTLARNQERYLQLRVEIARAAQELAERQVETLERDIEKAQAAETVAATVPGERLGGRLRRAGRAVENIFQRSRRPADENRDNDDSHLDEFLQPHIEVKRISS